MYHYVRPTKLRLSNRHNVLDLDLFVNQLEHLSEKHAFIDSQELLRLDNAEGKQKKTVWLTFDDGYKDCIDHVLPALLRFGAKGTFYVPTEAIFERKLLDVNKVHIILSSSASPKKIVEVCRDLFIGVNFEREVGIRFTDLFATYGVANPWNDAETEFIKKFLQKALPTSVRKKIIDLVFAQVVNRSESDWVDQFYLNADDLNFLRENGMEIGSHGHSHSWLADMGMDEQKSDLMESFRLIDEQTPGSNCKTICYPFGSYNSDTLRILTELSISSGVVNSGQRVATIGDQSSDLLELDRIDCMYFDEFARGDFDD